MARGYLKYLNGRAHMTYIAGLSIDTTYSPLCYSNFDGTQMNDRRDYEWHTMILFTGMQQTNYTIHNEYTFVSSGKDNVNRSSLIASVRGITTPRTRLHTPRYVLGRRSFVCMYICGHSWYMRFLNQMMARMTMMWYGRECCMHGRGHVSTTTPI